MRGANEVRNSIIIPFAFLALLAGCQQNFRPQPLSEITYRTYKVLPCNFNGAQVGGPPDVKIGPRFHKCTSGSTPYSGRVGFTIRVPRGTPVYAIADLKVVRVDNKSGLQRCNHPRAKTLDGCQRPYDDLHAVFEDTIGNVVHYYHLMAEGNLVVEGFGKGGCKTQLDWNDPLIRSPWNCGGITKRTFKKGELIGFSGQTGNDPHVSLGIYLGGKDARYPGTRGRVNPTVAFEWESKPSNNPLFYSLPILNLDMPLNRSFFPRSANK